VSTDDVVYRELVIIDQADENAALREGVAIWREIAKLAIHENARLLQDVDRLTSRVHNLVEQASEHRAPGVAA
jgi:hypothetical protein